MSSMPLQTSAGKTGLYAIVFSLIFSSIFMQSLMLDFTKQMFISVIIC